MKKFLLVIPLVAAVAGCGAVPTLTSPKPTVTVTKEAAPTPDYTYNAPTPEYTYKPRPAQTDEQIQQLLRIVWSGETALQKSQICTLYNSDPDAGFTAFNSETSHPISRADFDAFFDSVC